MRKLNEQWIEIIDGQKHMVKAVAPIELCQGCLYNCNQGGCCWKGFDDCQMGSFFIIKDLGMLNDDGLLPCPFCGEYPSLENNGYFWYCCTNDDCLAEVGTGKTKQEAIDIWNRRA